MGNEEEVPYRSPVDIGEAEEVEPQDEEDFSTLEYLYKEFSREMKNLSSIDVLELKDNEDGLTIKEQIAAYKKAKAIIEPLYDLLKTRVGEIKQKQGRGK